MENLPQPATVTEMYLAAVLAELRAIRALLQQQAERPAVPAGQVVLQEPGKGRGKR